MLATAASNMICLVLRLKKKNVNVKESGPPNDRYQVPLAV